MRVVHQNQNQAAQSRGGGFGSKSLSRGCRRRPPLILRPKDQQEQKARSPFSKKPRLDSIGGGCWFRGGATQAEQVASPSRSFTFSEITDRLSSTSENPQVVNNTPTKLPMSVPKFNEYVASDGTIVAMGP